MSERISIPGPAGNLEVLMEQAGGAESYAVIGHPHPLYGGTMDNVQGDADEVVDSQAVISWAGTLSPAPQLAVLAGVGHFFHGHLHELRDAVIASMRSG